MLLISLGTHDESPDPGPLSTSPNLHPQRLKVDRSEYRFLPVQRGRDGERKVSFLIENLRMIHGP